MVPIKRRLSKKSIDVKCKALNDLENGMTNKDVEAKYGVSKKTLSTWVKNKHKLITSLEKKGMSSSRNVVFYWFRKRYQEVPIDGIIFKDKALEFAKTLEIKEFKTSDCWLNQRKKRYKYNSSFLFALFCTTVNIFTQTISIIFHRPEIFNLQETCIPYPSSRLTSSQLCILHPGLLWENKISSWQIFRFYQEVNVLL